MKRNSYALITGASSGIGKSIANECAQRGMNLMLVALPDTGLTRVATLLRQQYKVEVITAEGDLTHETFLLELERRVAESQLKLQVLVNNAGIGYEGRFEQLSTDFCNTVMHLNMQAMVILCKMFIPYLQLCERSYILNVSSLASFSPMPYKSLYSASKTFVYSFTRALRSELKGSGISVSVLCPGAVPTNARIQQSIRAHGKWGSYFSLSPDLIAAAAIEGTLKGKSVIIPGIFNRVCRYLMHLIPDDIKLPLLCNQYSHLQVRV